MTVNEIDESVLAKLNEVAEALGYNLEDMQTELKPNAKKRDYFITINSGAKCFQSGKATYENMKEYLYSVFENLLYACWDEEMGDNGNLHLHLFVSLQHGVSFSSMQKKFEGAHIQPKKGSAYFAMNYIKKPKGLTLKGDEKSHTQTKPMMEVGDFGTIVEKGLYNKDGALIAKPKKSINQRIKELVAKYDTLEEIAVADPYVYNTYRTTLQELLDQKHFDNFVSNPRVEKIEGKEGTFYKVNKLVYYIYGQEGCGKTYSTRLQFGGKGKVGKVTFNKGVPNFDNYDGEPVMYLNEFKGNIPLSVLQNLLEEEPTMLDARYADKKNFAIIYIFDSNIPFQNLYPNVKKEEPDKYKSFIRRFTGGVWETYQTNDGVRYIALHEEFLPKSKRYGDKYDPNKIECPLSEKWTGYKRVPLAKLEEIKLYEWLNVFETVDGYDVLKSEYLDYHEWIAEKESMKQITLEELDFINSLNYKGPRNFEDELSFCDWAICASMFTEERQQLMWYAARNNMRKKYNCEIRLS